MRSASGNQRHGDPIDGTPSTFCQASSRYLTNGRGPPCHPSKRSPRYPPAPWNGAFPDANADERQAFLDGLKFFSTPHTAAEGAGIDSNQPFCQGCHRNAEELPRDTQLVTTSSPISRAGRSTPTNFRFTSLNPMSG